MTPPTRPPDTPNRPTPPRALVPPRMPDVWLPLSEAAPLFNVSVSTLRRRIANGQLDAKREDRAHGFRWLVRMPGHGSADRPDTQSPSPEPLAPAQPAVGLADEIQRAISEASALLDREIELARRRAEIAARLAVAERPRPADQITVPATESAPQGAGALSDRHGARWFLLATVVAIALFALVAADPGIPSGLLSVATVVAVLSAVVACGEGVTLVTRRGTP